MRINSAFASLRYARRISVKLLLYVLLLSLVVPSGCVIAQDAAGRLVRPFDVALPAGYAYYIVTAPEDWDRPKVRAFREWLEAEKAGVAPAAPAATHDRLSGPIKAN